MNRTGLNAPAPSSDPEDPGPTCSAIPACIPATLRRGPLLPLEDEAEYEELLEGFAREMKPQSLMTFLIVKDAADATWEQMRLRRLRDAHWAASGARAARHVINEVSPGNCFELTISDLDRSRRMDRLHAAWLTGEEEQCQQVEALLAVAGTSEEAFYGRSLADEIDTHRKIDAMIASRIRTRLQAPKELQALEDCTSDDKSRAGASTTPVKDNARLARH